MMGSFIVVGTQRTGSTVLCNSLNFHPAIACGGEWVHGVPLHRKLTVTRRALGGNFSVLTPMYRELIAKYYHEGTRWLGFKVLFRSSDKWLLHPRFSAALWLDGLETYVRWLSQRPDIRVVHIVRDDVIEWLKSKYLASKTGFFTGKSYPDGMKVQIPPREAVSRLRAKNWIDARLGTLAGTNPYVRVSYEDFLQSSRAVLVSLIRFLDCDPAAFREMDYPHTRKQSKGRAQDYISNYDQLMAELEYRALAG